MTGRAELPAWATREPFGAGSRMGLGWGWFAGETKFGNEAGKNLLQGSPGAALPCHTRWEHL